MAEVLNFSQTLNRLMQKYNLAATALSPLAGGRAEFKKILAENSTSAKRTLFLQNLLESGLIKQGEGRQLELALEVSHLGIEHYRFQQSIRRILQGCPTLAFSPLCLENETTLQERLAFLQKADTIEIICINCCFHSVIAALVPLFSNQEKNIQMWHLLHADAFANAAASFVGVTFPLLFDARYLPYGIEVPPGGDVQAVGGNLLVIRAFTGSIEQQLCFTVLNGQHAIEMPNANEAKVFSSLARILHALTPPPFPFKESPSQNGDYTLLCMNYLSHELNRATYSISNDLLFHQTPTDIAITALQEKGIFANEMVQTLIKRTAAIHEQRYQNQYCKKKDTYRIMTYAGCERFLKTGLCTDHFFGFRAFTPEERKRIFRETIDYAQKNPHFIPLLIKDHAFECRCNLVCYDKLGVSLDLSDTDYDMEKGHHSIFLMFPEFTRQYMEFYLSTLVNSRCHTRQESLALLEEMYERNLAENQ